MYMYILKVVQKHWKKHKCVHNKTNFNTGSGADIAAMCNEAALHAAKHGKKRIFIADFDFGLDRVLGGLLDKENIFVCWSFVPLLFGVKINWGWGCE